MKSVLQAGWLLTVAIGNIVMIIVAESAALSEKVSACCTVLFVDFMR